MGNMIEVKRRVVFCRFNVGVNRETGEPLPVNFDVICDKIASLEITDRTAKIKKDERLTMVTVVARKPNYKFVLSHIKTQDFDPIRRVDGSTRDIEFKDEDLGMDRQTCMIAYCIKPNDWVLGYIVNEGAPSASKFTDYLWHFFKDEIKNPPFNWAKKPKADIIISKATLDALNGDEAIALAEIGIIGNTANTPSKTAAGAIKQTAKMFGIEQAKTLSIKVGAMDQENSQNFKEWVKSIFSDPEEQEPTLSKAKIKLVGSDRLIDLITSSAQIEATILCHTKGRMNKESAWSAIQTTYEEFERQGVFRFGGSVSTNDQEDI